MLKQLSDYYLIIQFIWNPDGNIGIFYFYMWTVSDLNSINAKHIFKPMLLVMKLNVSVVRTKFTVICFFLINMSLGKEIINYISLCNRNY